MNYNGMAVIVTGAGAGIGQTAAFAFAKKGARVVVAVPLGGVVA